MKHFLLPLTATILYTTMAGMETTTIVPEHNCSGATLFQQATSQRENEFPSFWGKLSLEQQKELTNNAGPREYNNPGLTALIADNYIVGDAIANNLIPSMNMGKIVRYMSKQMLQKNLLCDKENVSQLGGPQKLITHENGSYHSIPKTFEKHGKCTGNTSCMRFMSVGNHEEPYIVMSNRTVGNYDYIVTAEQDSKNLCICRI